MRKKESRQNTPDLAEYGTDVLESPFSSRTAVEIILYTELMLGKGQCDPFLLIAFSGWDIIAQHH